MSIILVHAFMLQQWGCFWCVARLSIIARRFEPSTKPGVGLPCFVITDTVTQTSDKLAQPTQDMYTCTDAWMKPTGCIQHVLNVLFINIVLVTKEIMVQYNDHPMIVIKLLHVYLKLQPIT